MIAFRRKDVEETDSNTVLSEIPKSPQIQRREPSEGWLAGLGTASLMMVLFVRLAAELFPE